VAHRVALITGSTAGLGLDLAAQLTRVGHAVAVNGRSGERVRAAIAAVRAEVPGAELFAAPADITDSAQVDDMVARCRDALGPIDMLVHAAVVRNEAPLIETSDEAWEENFGACLDGAFYCTRAVLPDMLERGWGRIVYYGGISTEIGIAGRAALVAAKNGLYGLTKAVAAEVGDRGITVNAISPGVIEDDPDAMADDERTARRRALIDGSRLKRFGTTREVNAATMFLLSEDGGYVTAQKLSVSGGLVAC
jgi:NAD(P)-dependent dehydrogenase (short-subunit alcohol dehydrogenase family)